MSDDIFLFTLIMNAGRRGTHFALKADEVEGVVDNWLYYFSGISPERQKQGGFTKRRVEDLKLAASIINRRPVFAEQSKGGPIVRYLVARNFTASGSTD
ncbi:MAG: hypothetical protein H0T51_15530 [Pirellulales bacterium]|nr:hypothetical protein [Pirellulales bacterium]